MKNWLTIGTLSKKVGMTPRTLRIYEDLGLMTAHARGDNGYRYYSEEQIHLIERIKGFKDLGFSLQEIKSLLEIDPAMNSEKLESYLTRRLSMIEQQAKKSDEQKQKVQSILSSLRKNKQGLSPLERRYIMTSFEKIGVVVAGVRNLQETAELIKTHIKKGGKEIPVQIWDGTASLPSRKPFIVVIAEEFVSSPKITGLAPDIVVIKELSRSSQEIEKAYLQLYSEVGPQMSTILNADDRAVVELAGNETLRKGKTYYFSKNSGIADQIQRIGGVVSDGEVIEIFGFNQSPHAVRKTLEKPLGYDEEISLLASLAAVMDIGLNEAAVC